MGLWVWCLDTEVYAGFMLVSVVFGVEVQMVVYIFLMITNELE